MTEARPQDAPRYMDEHTEEPGSGIIRATVFGVSDGLVSNLALVMGVAGGTSARSTILLAGVAGLVAGAFSMAAGEYISMRTQREVYERELRVEREHIEKYPDEERAHLTELLVEAGLDRTSAERVASQVHQRPEPAVGFHARFELGIIPEELGSPIGAAIASFAAFMFGAAIPLIPFFLTTQGLVASIAISAVALGAVGAVLTRLTGQKAVYGGVRQVVVGAVAASVTYGIGAALGAAVR